MLPGPACFCSPQRPVVAQGDPHALTTDPTFGAPGDVITIIGTGYTPGGYPGIVFWDGVEADTLTIPDGGANVPFRVPIGAGTDEHIVEVCAANGMKSGDLVCSTGDLQQRTETLFMVGPTVDAPTLSTDPTSAKAGALITLIREKLHARRLRGLVFWDSNGIDRLKIPAGACCGAVRVPADAFVGEHSISVCAAENGAGGNLTCRTGSFDQRRDTLRGRARPPHPRLQGGGRSVQPVQQGHRLSHHRRQKRGRG
ncbi:MAG: hypothetical protein R2838_00210 [Caldilineaceae bacterium]